MNRGWIALHRSIQKNWLWNDHEPFDRRSAWIDLLLLATHTDNKEFYHGRVEQRKRGEVCCSILWLAERWSWSRGKVERFLKTLSRDGMCAINSTTNGTIITIENYSKYQNVRATDKATDKATNEQPASTPNNVRTIKNNYYAEPKTTAFVDGGIMALSDEQLKILRGE